MLALELRVFDRFSPQLRCPSRRDSGSRRLGVRRGDPTCHRDCQRGNHHGSVQQLALYLSLASSLMLHRREKYTDLGLSRSTNQNLFDLKIFKRIRCIRDGPNHASLPSLLPKDGVVDSVVRLPATSTHTGLRLLCEERSSEDATKCY